jgi:hypothetical protein
MFLSVSGGDIHFARMAAAEALKIDRSSNPLDLIASAQIIACGLTALGSLSRSMADDISLSMTLRLRGNAVALNRAAELNRRALHQSVSATAPAATDAPAIRAAGVTAGYQEARQTAANAPPVQQPQAFQPPAKPATPAPPLSQTPPFAATPAPPLSQMPPFAATPALPLSQTPPFAATPAPPLSQTPPFAATPAFATTARQRQESWASAMTDVAREFTAELKHLPPAEQKIASHRAAALNTCASQLLLGHVPPPLAPGDLAVIIQPNRPG